MTDVCNICKKLRAVIVNISAAPANLAGVTHTLSLARAAHPGPSLAIAAAATILGNVGPAFGVAGPFGSFDEFSPLSKVIMILLMWLGRVEILPVVVLLTRAYWRS